MYCFRFISLSMLTIVVAACGSSETSVNSPGAGGDKKGYGYEFAADSTKNPKPAMTPSATAKLGHLQPDIIQGVVRQDLSKFKDCYDAGLQRDRKLAGIFRARFVIQEDGSVTDTSDSGSTLIDKQLSVCVLGAFATLTFPKSESGIVSVVYPMEFAP
jgi:hypothetical protein